MIATDHVFSGPAGRQLDRPFHAKFWLLLPVVFSVFLSGCLNIVPIARIGENKDALALAKVLKSQHGAAIEELQREHIVAQELKVTLEESGQLQPEVFGQKFSSYLDQLIAIRNKRRQIIDTVRQNTFDSPLVFAIQRDALDMVGYEMERTQTWIELAQNVKLRTELRATVPEAQRAKKDFPELKLLNHELDTFLAQTGEDPLGAQLSSLQAEYRSLDIFGSE